MLSTCQRTSRQPPFVFPLLAAPGKGGGSCFPMIRHPCGCAPGGLAGAAVADCAGFVSSKEGISRPLILPGPCVWGGAPRAGNSPSGGMRWDRWAAACPGDSHQRPLGWERLPLMCRLVRSGHGRPVLVVCANGVIPTGDLLVPPRMGQGGRPLLFPARCTGLPVLLAAGWPGPKERQLGGVTVVLVSAHGPAGPVLPDSMPRSGVLPCGLCCVDG